MTKYYLTMFVMLVGCGQSSGSSVSSLPLTIENLVGHWRVVRTSVNGESLTTNGAAIIEYKGDGTYVSATENFYPEGQSSEACWSANTGTFLISNNVLTTLMEDEVGLENCISGDYNPRTHEVQLTATSMSVRTSRGYIYLDRTDDLPSFLFESLRDKFEKVELTVSDTDQPNDLRLSYRSPRQAGWRYVCPRLAGREREGFTISITFLFKSAVYDAFLQWEEGDIDPDNYDGATPGFDLDKRAATDSDTFKTPGSGRYSCPNATNCASKCSLKVTNYSLPESTGEFLIACSALPAVHSTDPDNLFGPTLSNFSLKVRCDYKPDLGL